MSQTTAWRERSAPESHRQRADALLGVLRQLVDVLADQHRADQQPVRQRLQPHRRRRRAAQRVEGADDHQRPPHHRRRQLAEPAALEAERRRHVGDREEQTGDGEPGHAPADGGDQDGEDDDVDARGRAAAPNSTWLAVSWPERIGWGAYSVRK